MYIADAKPGARGIPLEGNLHSENNRDISVWQLQPRLVSELPNRKFLTIHHADRADLRVTRGWYYIHGYPNYFSQSEPEKNKITIKPFTFGAILYAGDTSTFKGYDPNLHVLLAAPKDGNVDSHGAETEMPQSLLKGISGSSIWQSYYDGLPSDSWTVDDAVVVAVQTGTYRDGTIVRGTRWIIEKILSKNYPELQVPLAIMTTSSRKSS
jgi:hypothetical protein